MSEMHEPQLHIVPLRPTVQVSLPDGTVIEGPRGTQLELFMKKVPSPPAPIVGGVVNGELRELTYPIAADAVVRPVTMADNDGMRIYRRSLTFLLAAAFEELFPGAYLAVDHSVFSGGYFCEVREGNPLSREDLQRLEARMLELVEEDLPFAKCQIKLEEAIAYFKERGYEDKVALLRYRRKPHLVVYQLGNFRDYHHGYMLPSTGYLQWFALAETDGGFTLRFTRRHSPTDLSPLPEYPKLLATFRQYGDWLEMLGVASAGTLNDGLAAGRAREIILVAEALHEQRIAAIAEMIAARQERPRIVLIAGPSASGKTTFSRRLSVQLLALGISPFPIEMDSFFVDREKSPKDEFGQYDFESLEALDLARLNQDLRQLGEGRRVQLPRYDFKNGRQVDGQVVQLQQDHIILLEGIHGLDPALLPQIPPQHTFRIYVSALTQLNLDRYNRVSTTDTRLIRRIVRDAAERGYSASDTIRGWDSVSRGEKRYIFPYQENADVMFNSALLYEGGALAPLAEPLIRQVAFGTPEHVEAKRLLAFLEWFLPIDNDLIPDNSILREFIGGSILRDFKPLTTHATTLD
jgi:uridine kinase